MPRLSYASLPEIKAAIKDHKEIRFQIKGVVYEVEPICLDSAPRTHAIELIGYVNVSPGDGQNGWRKFCFSMMRGMERTGRTFLERRPVGFRLARVG